MAHRLHDVPGRSLPAAPRTGVVGASGLVGETLVEVLGERAFPCAELVLFGSAAGGRRDLSVGGRTLAVEPLDEARLAGLDLVFFAATGALSLELAPRLARSGVLAIDKSATFRAAPEVPLVVPEVNGAELRRHRGLVASPNCTTIGLVHTLAPLHRLAGLRRVSVTTVQAVSGAGRAGLAALRAEGRDPELARGGEAFPARIAGDVLPWCDEELPSGSTGEEEKLLLETRRLLGLPGLVLQATCLRVPVEVGHGAAVEARFARPVDPAAARAVLEAEPSVRCPESGRRVEAGRSGAATPRAVAGTDEVRVDRLRQGAGPDELLYWEVSDNLRRGAATNAVRIAEELLPR